MSQQHKSWTRGERFSAIGLVLTSTGLLISFISASVNKDIRCSLAHIDCNKSQLVTVTQPSNKSTSSKSNIGDESKKVSSTSINNSPTSEREERYIASLTWPVKGNLTSSFGKTHQGIDIAGPLGTPVIAAADGVIITSEFQSGNHGKFIEIRHKDGSISRYANNNQLIVVVGQVVKQGQHISDMGNTGRSTGPHLHFEYQLGSSTVNPLDHLPK